MKEEMRAGVEGEGRRGKETGSAFEGQREGRGELHMKEVNGCEI